MKTNNKCDTCKVEVALLNVTLDERPVCVDCLLERFMLSRRLVCPHQPFCEECQEDGNYAKGM